MLKLEEEVEAFVLNTQNMQHIFSKDMTSYEVRGRGVRCGRSREAGGAGVVGVQASEGSSSRSAAGWERSPDTGSPLRLRPQRLLAHRTAQHWGLETTTISQGPDQGKIVAYRAPQTAVPKVGDCCELAGWLPVGRLGPACSAAQPVMRAAARARMLMLTLVLRPLAYSPVCRCGWRRCL